MGVSRYRRGGLVRVRAQTLTVAAYARERVRGRESERVHACGREREREIGSERERE